ncbi:hypothetical protein GCM10025871_15040 [Deinococcus metallilatus]|nr:hypothetical protein GCM10025871_15040 [Deinococcus metallilatus]
MLAFPQRRVLWLPRLKPVLPGAGAPDQVPSVMNTSGTFGVPVTSTRWTILADRPHAR